MICGIFARRAMDIVPEQLLGLSQNLIIEDEAMLPKPSFQSSVGLIDWPLALNVMTLK